MANGNDGNGLYADIGNWDLDQIPELQYSCFVQHPFFHFVPTILMLEGFLWNWLHISDEAEMKKFVL